MESMRRCVCPSDWHSFDSWRYDRQPSWHAPANEESSSTPSGHNNVSCALKKNPHSSGALILHMSSLDACNWSPETNPFV
eukprot:scaffold537988_cov42-Prasinocladus_malaysianus.AAC.1